MTVSIIGSSQKTFGLPNTSQIPLLYKNVHVHAGFLNTYKPAQLMRLIPYL